MLTDGVHAWKIDLGPGYCVYCAEQAIAFAKGLGDVA